MFPVGFSALSIQSVFLAGLTLVYCAWLVPIGFLNVEQTLNDCQLLLYIITERYPSSKRYRDIFERIKSAVLSLMQAGKHQPGQPVNIDVQVHRDCAGLQETWPYGMNPDFTHMMNAITGQNFVPYGIDPSIASMSPSDTALQFNWSQGSQSLGPSFSTSY